ncbi:MAG: hypothetical protein A2505_03115 [Deltaproteobacteria bacterium RIFOXYD12_FULL_55_16]|nr:MAG: hypothetical protein A2505_03115 [Deltaproteobacteria bacterium RIFOXYD12_FULL_55_16]
MKTQDERHCWQITNCRSEDNCPAWNQGRETRPCWEVVLELDDYRSALNVCKDCIVFISKEHNTALSEEEVQAILERKIECVLAPQCSAAGE